MKKALGLSMALILATAATAQTWFKGTLDQAIAKAKSENSVVRPGVVSAALLRSVVDTSEGRQVAPGIGANTRPQESFARR